MIRKAHFGGWTAALSSGLATVLLAACGGGPAPVSDLAQAGIDVKMRQAPQASPSAVSPGHSNDKFGNFNPEIWSHHEWYECDCGRTPQRPQRTAPWSTTTG